MKQSLLALLACPQCSAKLSVSSPDNLDGQEIIEGEILCNQCDLKFPIKKGVPHFCENNRDVSNFSDEWSRFSRVQYDQQDHPYSSDEFFGAKTPWSVTDISGKLILDAGCGGGRYMDTVSRHGGTVVGIDLSDSVYATFENIGARENVHIVQGSIFSLPFKQSLFDLAYSIGVLQHTGDGRKAFGQITGCVKSGGELSVWVYEHSNIIVLKDILFRKTIGRLPLSLVHIFTHLSTPLYHLCRLPVLCKLKRCFSPPFSMHEDKNWRILDTFDWLTPVHQAYYKWPEVFSWFEENGYAEIGIKEPGITAYGKKK